MDNLTHSLFGLTLARTPLGRAGRGTTTALFLASNAPDADIVVTIGGAAKYLEFHRGPTHGPLGLVGLAALVAGLVWAGRRQWDRNSTDPPASFLTLWAVSMLGILGHILMDLPTSYGTRPLSPFSWTWFTLDWMPIVDIYLLAIFGAAFWLARGAGTSAAGLKLRQRCAAAALILMTLDYTTRGLLHHQAIARAGDAFEGRLPQWCADGVRPTAGLDYWPRTATAAMRDTNAGHCLVELAAMPGFVSPFSWRLIARLSNAYEVRDVDLLSGAGLSPDEPLATRTLPLRVPNQWTPAVMHAAAAPTAQVFLGFSRFPAVRSTVGVEGAMVQWSDLRFLQGPLDGERQFRDGLFSATVVLNGAGQVLVDQLGPRVDTD